ncbi:MAG: hypothetical protein QM706_18755 [Nitrospira sp.]
MSLPWLLTPRLVVRLLVVGVGVGIILSAGHGQSESCSLSAVHGGLTFPVQRVDSDWACKLQDIIQDHTTETKVGPVRAALSESMYRHLLDHPPFAADVIGRLHLGLYRSEARGPSRFWGDDGEGTKGTVELVYEDPTSRIYFLEGTHESRILPHVTGKAVVFLRIGFMQGENGDDTTDSTLVAYTRLDNRVLSGLVSLLHPLVTRVVKSRLHKGVETVDRLGRLMRQDPRRVMAVLASPPSLPEHHVAFLKQALRDRPSADNSSTEGRSIP